MRKESGLTLIELMITVAIVAILASLAVPNFRDLLVKRSATAAAESLVGDLRFSRSEALKRANTVTMCQTTDGITCSTVLGAWRNGWIVFVDADADGVIDAADDTPLRVQQGFTAIQSIQGGASTQSKFTFQATGLAKAASESFLVTPSGTVPAGSVRLVCVSNQGRPSLRAVGSAACI